MKALVIAITLLFCISEAMAYQGYDELVLPNISPRESLHRKTLITIPTNNFDFRNLWSYHKFTLHFEDYSSTHFYILNNRTTAINSLKSGEEPESLHSIYLFFLGLRNRSSLGSSSTNKITINIEPYDNALESFFAPSDTQYLIYIDDNPSSPKYLEYSFETSVIYFFSMLMVSLILFTQARLLSESTIVYYFIWIISGMIVSIIVLIILALYYSKDRIGLPNVLGISAIILLLSFFTIPKLFEQVLIGYLLLGGLIGGIMGYYYSNKRNYALTRTAAKVTAVVGFYLSFQSVHFFVIFTSLLFLFQIRFVRRLFSPILYPLYWIKWNYFPNRRKLLTPREYKEQGAKYTKLGIDELIQQIRDDPTLLHNLSDIARDRVGVLLRTGDHLGAILDSSRNINSPSSNLN